MSAGDIDWMEAEGPLLDRIRSRVPIGTKVMLEADMPEDWADLPLPVVILKYDGFAPVEDSPDSLASVVRAEWVAIVGDRIGNEIDAAGPARARLAKLTGTVLRSVLGFAIPGVPYRVTPSKTQGAFQLHGLTFNPVGFGFNFVAVGDCD